MTASTIYEILFFYNIGFFRESGQFYQWLFFFTIVLCLYFICLAIYGSYRKKKGLPFIGASIVIWLLILIVMWVFHAVPDRMVTVFAMVFGAHLLPYSWLYKSLSYRIFSIAIPIVSLIVGCVFSAFSVAVTMLVIEIIFVLALFVEMHMFIKKH